MELPLLVQEGERDEAHALIEIGHQARRSSLVIRTENRSRPSHVDCTGSRLRGSSKPISSTVCSIRPKLHGARVTTRLSELLEPPRLNGTM